MMEKSQLEIVRGMPGISTKSSCWGRRASHLPVPGPKLHRKLTSIDVTWYGVGDWKSTPRRLEPTR